MKLKRILSLLICVILCGSCMLGTACGGTGSKNDAIKDTNITLAANKTSDYKIVIPADGKEVLTTVANEISMYLEFSTGAKLVIVKDALISNHTDDDHVISLGETTMQQSSGITATIDEVTREGYKIVRKKNTVYIIGPTERGTAYGGLEFLKQQIGYEVYTSDEIDYQKYDTLYLKDFNLTDIPTLETREMDGMAQFDQDTSFRLRLSLMFGGAQERYDNDNASYFIPDADHNTEKIISIERNPDYAKYHSSGSTQVCFTQGNGLEQAYITELIKYATEDKPDAYIVNVSQEDGKDFCKCDTCQAEIDKYGVGGLWIRFMNKIVAGMEEWRLANCPDRYMIYTTYCYGETKDPPVVLQANGTYKEIDDTVIPHEKLYCRLIFNPCPQHSLDDPDCAENSRAMNMIDGWRAITDRFFYWDYAADFQNFLPYYNDISRIQGNIRVYKDLGVSNYFLEHTSGGAFTQFGYLRMYLHGKLTWNVDQDINVLIDNFFEHYFKDVAPEMRAILELYRTHDAEKDICERHVTLERFPKSLVEATEVYFDRAEEKIAKISDYALREKLQRRVSNERTCTDFLKAFFYDSYGYDKDEYADHYNALKAKLEAMNMPRFREHESMEAWLEKNKP